MNKNAPKIILAGVLLVAAVGLILWNMGIIGGGPEGRPSIVDEEAQPTQEELAEQNKGASPEGNKGSLGGLTKDNF